MSSASSSTLRRGAKLGHHGLLLSSVLAPSSCPTPVASMACCGTQPWKDGAELGIFSTYGISPSLAVHKLGHAGSSTVHGARLLRLATQPSGLSLSSAMPRSYHGGNSDGFMLKLPHAHPLLRSAMVQVLHGVKFSRSCCGIMSSLSREWSWEPRVPIHPSLLEMTPLRIPSPALDSPEYSCQGRGVNPYSLEEGDTSRGLVGVPPSYPLAARLEGRSPKKLRIKLNSRSLGESSQSRPETTTLCLVDAVDTLGPLPGQGEVVPSERSNNESPLKSSMRPAGCPELELSSSSFLSIRGGGSDWLHDPDDDDVRSYVSSEEARLQTPPLQDLIGILSLDETGVALDMTKGRRLQLPSGAFARGGRGRRGARGRGRPDSLDRARVSTRDPEDRDRRSSRDAEDRPPKPPSAELTRGKGVASDYPRESQKRRPPTGPIYFQDPIGGRELAIPLGGSACGSSSSVTPTSYAKEGFKYEMIDGHRVELDSNGNILPRDLRFAGPQLKICGLPYPDDGFICCESNALALAQAMDNVILADQRAYCHETKGRMAEWMGRDLNWNLVQSLNIAGRLISVSQEAIVDRDAVWSKVKTLEEEIAGLRELYKELTHKYNESQDSVLRLEGSLKKERNQSTSCLTELKSAQGKCGELERKIERLEKRIAELEQQHPSSTDEMIDRWQVSEEGMAAITELARPATKVGCNMAFQHFSSYLSEVPADKKWDGLPWPHDDIGVTDQNVPYYIADGPPAPIVIDAEEEGEQGEVNLTDS
ncbi:hypothetical protein Dimus_007553 [Dionaea muscipula]